MFDLMHLVGTSKEQLRIKLTFILQCSDSFSKWFEDRFMKYGGVADHSDIEVLEESIAHIIKEKLK